MTIQTRRMALSKNWEEAVQFSEGGRRLEEKFEGEV